MGRKAGLRDYAPASLSRGKQPEMTLGAVPDQLSEVQQKAQSGRNESRQINNKQTLTRGAK